jgi:ABC-type phosphate transport system auxiliary subunit
MISGTLGTLFLLWLFYSMIESQNEQARLQERIDDLENKTDDEGDDEFDVYDDEDLYGS